jgi:hypothetical protein
MPPEVLEYLRTMGKKYGSKGGKRSLETMTAAERSARAKKASLAAAKKRTADRLARERRRKGTPARGKGEVIAANRLNCPGVRATIDGLTSGVQRVPNFFAAKFLPQFFCSRLNLAAVSPWPRWFLSPARGTPVQEVWLPQ